ncbi:MAG: D-sedoheptulose-7-phosphate isomerase [Gaiellaceae bacterium]
MSETASRGSLDTALDRVIASRSQAGEQFFAAEADHIARLCHAMAKRFARGGRLLAVGSSPQAWSDASHVAVEFVHPVIVGKRALPALAVASPDFDLIAREGDMVMNFDDLPVTGSNKGLLTISFHATGAEWVFDPRSSDPFVRQELVETTYHMLWELVHVFLDHIGGSAAGAGASSFLYPFLDEEARDLANVEEDVRGSVLLKAAEIGELRSRTVEGGRSELVAAARALSGMFAGGGTLFAFGNGGSATDAMDVVADFRAAPQGWTARKAIDLTADSAILTALANDIGTEVVFGRQIIAYAGAGDAALALSTSGDSTNIIEALAEADRRGLLTIAFVGYDGGRVAREGLADHVVVTESQHIPRIQEAQATAYHALRELIELTAA